MYIYIYISNPKQPSCKKSAQNSPELSLLKFLPLTYHHSHFLAATLDFTSFFTIAFLRAAHFFTARLFWIRIHFFLYLYIPKPAYGQLWDFFNLSFFLPQEEEKMKWMYFKYFISKCTNYIYNTYIDYRNLHGGFFVTEHSTR